MTTIEAKCIAKSKHPDADITVSTVIATYPRWIHAEGRTHRLLRIGESYDFVSPRTPSPMEDPNLSRNAASSRAIPVSKMIEQVLTDPAIPVFWGKNIAGMQAAEELSLNDRRHAEHIWLQARDCAVSHAQMLMSLDTDHQGRVTGCHKQIVNRLLEPFTHITVAFTATKWQNFFKLRIHPAAEPHIKLLAEAIRDAIEAVPARVLQYGQWHLPMVRDDEEPRLPIATSVARLARMSYLKHDNTTATDQDDIDLHDRLLHHEPMHASPAEHQCTPDGFENDHALGMFEWDQPEKHGNLHGFIQYRKTLAGEADHG